MTSLTPEQWLSQYEGLSLTSRGQHSALPHLRIPSCLFDTETKAAGRSKGSGNVLNDDNSSSHYGNIHKTPSSAPSSSSSSSTKSDHAHAQKQLSAESYVRYLKMYARRYGLERHMQLGCSVVKVIQSDVCQGEGEGDVESQCVGSEGCHEKTFTSFTGDNSNDKGYTRNQNRNMPSSPSSSSSSSTLKRGSEKGLERGIERWSERGSERGLGWEVHYTYLTPTGARGIAVTHCRCVVVACGKAQLPATDPHLMNILKGFTGYTVNAKDVKDLEGMIWYDIIDSENVHRSPSGFCIHHGYLAVHVYHHHSNFLFCFLVYGIYSILSINC